MKTRAEGTRDRGRARPGTVVLFCTIILPKMSCSCAGGCVGVCGERVSRSKKELFFAWDRQDCMGVRTNFQAIPPISVVSTFLEDDELSEKKQTFPGQAARGRHRLAAQEAESAIEAIGRRPPPDRSTATSTTRASMASILAHMSPSTSTCSLRVGSSASWVCMGALSPKGARSLP